MSKKSVISIVAIGLTAGLAVSANPVHASTQPLIAPSAKMPPRTLVIRVVGVPANAKPRVVVKGPGTYRKFIRVSGRKTRLKGLKPGKYTLRARAVSVSGDSRLPIASKLSVRVKKNRGTVARIYYSSTGTR